MAADPFPNTSDATTEARFNVIFSSTSTVLVVPTDPVEMKNGLVWLNTSTGVLKIYHEGVIWEMENKFSTK